MPAVAACLTVRGVSVNYDVATQSLTCLVHAAPLATVAGRVHLRLLLDRTSLEVFGNHGAVSIATCFLPDPGDTAVRLETVGGQARAVSLNVAWLGSAWE